MPKKKTKKNKDTKSKVASGHAVIAKYAKLYSFELPKDFDLVKKTSDNKKGAGRKPIVTEKVIRKLELAFAYDCTVEEACVSAGIYPSSYYEFLKKYPKFTDTVTQLRNIPTLVARNTIVAGVASSQDSAMRYMEKKRKTEFSSKLEVAAEVKATHSVDDETEKKIESVFSLVERAALKVVGEYNGENDDGSDDGELDDDGE